MTLAPGVVGEPALGPGRALEAPVPWKLPGLYQRAGTMSPSGWRAAQEP